MKKRYGFNKKAKSVNTGAIARDVAKLAMMINAEKKFFQYPTNNFQLGQVEGNGTGSEILDMTPYITQGVTANTRNGNSIKLHTSVFQFQFGQQTATASPMNIVIDMFHVKGMPETSLATTMANIYDVGVFSGIIDYFSNRNQNHYADYTLIRSKKVHIPLDSITGQLVTKSLTMPHKWNRGKGHHIRYQSNSASINDIANGQIIVTFRSDVGNSSATTPSTLLVYQTVPNTGTVVLWNFKHYFYDN